MYKIGQRFSNGNSYILAHVGNSNVSLINLDTGSMWSDYVYVEEVGNISEKEFKEICDGEEFYETNQDGDFGESLFAGVCLDCGQPDDSPRCSRCNDKLLENEDSLPL